jgi:hypothetical protein
MSLEHWQQQQQQERQHYVHHTQTRYPSSGGHLSSRHGLDVSRLAFGSILRDYIRTPAASPAMENILNRFLGYDYGIFQNVRALLSPVSFTVILLFSLCSIKATVNIGALQGKEILLSSTSSVVSDCHCPTAQRRHMQSGILNLFIGYVGMNIQMHWIGLK